MQRKQQPSAGRRPKIFRKKNPSRFEQLGILFQTVAGKLQDGGVSVNTFTKRVARWRSRSRKLLGRQLGLHHTVGLQAANARFVDLKTHGVYLAAHGVGNHGKRPAHAI